MYSRRNTVTACFRCRQGSVKTPQGRNSLHESGRNGNDSNGVFVCGRDILQVDDGKQSAAAALVRRVHALAGMDVQQVRISRVL